MNKNTYISRLVYHLKALMVVASLTQASLLREDLEALGFDVVFVRGNGGTAISEQIRRWYSIQRLDV